MVNEFDLSQLNRLVANVPKVKDLSMHGHLNLYDENYDKISSKNPQELQRITNKIFYDVSSSDDPVLQDFAADSKALFYTTDKILAQLMASPRSIFSWDIVIEKAGDMIFLDKRDNSSFDFLTVSETAQDLPNNDELEEYNSQENLSNEATMINQNFSQQILLDSHEKRKKVPILFVFLILLGIVIIFFIFVYIFTLLV